MNEIDLKIRNLLEENSDTIIINDRNIDIINIDIEMFLSDIKTLINEL